MYNTTCKYAPDYFKVHISTVEHTSRLFVHNQQRTTTDGTIINHSRLYLFARGSVVCSSYF